MALHDVCPDESHCKRVGPYSPAEVMSLKNRLAEQLGFKAAPELSTPKTTIVNEVGPRIYEVKEATAENILKLFD